jgi:hypothetical protein
MTDGGRSMKRWIGLRRSALLGVALGAGYGVFTRVVFSADPLQGVFLLMTVSFLVVVPIVIGYLTVHPVERPSWKYRLLAPWLPCTLSVATAWLVGWEGAICIVISLPLLLVLSSVGGLAAGIQRNRRAGHAAVVACLPFLLAPIEGRVPQPVRTQQNVTEIVVDAPVEAVWPEVVEVPAIAEREQRAALHTRLGFPRPVSAELTRPGTGGIRYARFEGGVLFIETITAWEEGRRIAFTIDAQTDSIPPTTLDPHVTIGGEYFDVLDGEYVLEPIDGGRTRIILTSSHRLSTHLNAYAGLWAGIIMRSIQDNILEIVRERAERRAGASGSGFPQDGRRGSSVEGL